MRKLLAFLLAVMMVLSCAAMAENADEMMALEYPDFTLAMRKDAVGTTTDTIENNIPFLTVYQDYDAASIFNKSINIRWTEDTLDLDSFEAKNYALAMLEIMQQQSGNVGIEVSNPMLYTAEVQELDGMRVLSCMYSLTMDYNPLGVDFKANIITFQAVMPLEGKGTYTFTITTDDMENSSELFDIMDSVRWK